MKRVLKYLARGLAALAVVALVAYFWAYEVATSRYHKQWTVHSADFPIPFPLQDDALAALRADRIAAGASAQEPLAGVDLQAVALERAIRSGKHLVESRTVCDECHGKDFGGHEMIDVPFVAHWAAPNLTSGEGGVTGAFSANDWDRAVRHGVRHNGQSSSMPSQDFVSLSDHELSDIVAYIRTMPPVNRNMGPAVTFGPVFALLIAIDPKPFAAFTIDHDKAHAAEPPAEAPSVDLGQHIVQICRGCHGPGLSGGSAPGEPANLTPHETGLKAWTESDFIRALREGKRKDGTPLSNEMPWKAFGQMSDTELKAIWAYLQTVPALEKGSR